MNNKTKNLVKIILPLLLGVVLVWYSLSKISIEELFEYFKKANYGWVVLGLFFGLLSHISRAYRWKFMIEPLGYKLGFPNSLMAVFAAYLVNYTIPRAGEITRATLITNYEGVPFEKGFGTIVAERAADMVMLLFIIGVTFFFQFEFIFNFFLNKFSATKIAMILGVMILFLGFGYVFIKKSNSKIAVKFKSFIEGLLEGVMVVFRMKKKWAFIFHTVFIWVMYVLMFYITTFAVAELSDISFGAILVGFIVGSFSIAATNGGIGSYPEAVVIAFLLFNLPEDPSRAFGWIMWASQTLMIIILGGISLVYLPIFNRNSKKAL
ncbi:MAG: flippase-like domain-containing protein [Flavobacteriaceae bacterium]|nr:flippase-like domain-containing protein [Flavobacteriaceae bacterium]